MAVITAGLLFNYKMHFHTSCNIFSVFALNTHMRVRTHTPTHP